MDKKGSILETENRHPALALLMQIGIRAKYLCQQWFFLKPILLGVCDRPSPFRPKKCPKYDVITRLGFVSLWTIVGFCRDTYLQFLYAILAGTGALRILIFIHKKLSDRLIAQMDAAGWKGDQEIPLPEFDWRNRSPQEFIDLFVKTKHPVVLRGFMKGTDLLKKLSFEEVMKNYSEEDVFLTRPELDGFEGKLKEVEIPNTYLHNSECLFNKYPHLRTLFQYEKLEPYLNMKPGYEQIFVGKAGTGSPFHHAAVFNMFYMIDGTKKWWFVDPYDAYLAYPIAAFGKAAGILAVLWPDSGNLVDFPLFKYCPAYSVTLQPGDVLFNPPWWWHSIKNTSPTSVAVASRWHTNGICGHDLMMTEEDYEVDRFSSMGFMAGPSSVPFLHGVLQTPSPRFDDHTTLREKNNRYVHKQLANNANGGIKLFGYTSKF